MSDSVKTGVKSAQPVKGFHYPAGAQVRLRASQHLLQTETASLKCYLGTIASGFQSEFAAFHAHVQAQAADMDEDTQQRYMEDRADTAHDLTSEFPRRAREATFVLAYSILEDDLLNIARNVGLHLGITKDPEKGKDKGIFAARSFLVDSCGIAFPEQGKPWQEILEYNRLRNAVVHKRGRIHRSKHREEIIAYVARTPSVTLNEGTGRLEFSQEFCFKVLDDTEALLMTLFTLALDKVRSVPESRA